MVALYNLKRRVVEAGRAVTGRTGVKKTSWTGHMLRSPDGHVAIKTALEWNPYEKNKRGKPRHTWRHTTT